MSERIEWAVEYKSFHDGPFDRLITHNDWPFRPYTEEEAREEVASMSGNRGQFHNIPEAVRVVSRKVTDWEES